MRYEPESSREPHDDAPSEAATPMFDFYVEQLETYLDGELQADEAAAVRQRLAEEPAYAAALDRLHGFRQIRLDALADTTHAAADEAAAARLRATASRLSLSGALAPDQSPVYAVDQNVADREVAGTLGYASAAPRWSRWKIGSAVAACLVIGFGMGLMGRYDFGGTPVPGVSNPYPEVPSNGTRTISDEKDDKPQQKPQDDVRRQSPRNELE